MSEKKDKGQDVELPKANEENAEVIEKGDNSSDSEIIKPQDRE